MSAANAKKKAKERQPYSTKVRNDGLSYKKRGPKSKAEREAAEKAATSSGGSASMASSNQAGVDQAKGSATSSTTNPKVLSNVFSDQCGVMCDVEPSPAHRMIYRGWVSVTLLKEARLWDLVSDALDVHCVEDMAWQDSFKTPASPSRAIAATRGNVWMYIMTFMHCLELFTKVCNVIRIGRFF